MKKKSKEAENEKKKEEAILQMRYWGLIGWEGEKKERKRKEKEKERKKEKGKKERKKENIWKNEENDAFDLRKKMGSISTNLVVDVKHRSSWHTK